MKKLIILSMLATILLSACGPKATPTMNPADVQSTAFAAASTMVAQTQAAIPTATPVPPTETPAPTATLQPTVPPPPTSSIPTLQPTAAPNTNADPCNAPMASDPDGPTTTIKIDNQSSGPANVSLFLSKTPFGECGYRGYSLTKNGSVIVTMPQGCYSVYAWINGKKPSTASGYGCINNPDKWTFVVRDDLVKLSPP